MYAAVEVEISVCICYIALLDDTKSQVSVFILIKHVTINTDQ